MQAAGKDAAIADGVSSQVSAALFIVSRWPACRFSAAVRVWWRGSKPLRSDSGAPRL